MVVVSSPKFPVSQRPIVAPLESLSRMAYEWHFHSVRLFEFEFLSLPVYGLDKVTVLHHHTIAYMVMSVLKLIFRSYHVKYS